MRKFKKKWQQENFCGINMMRLTNIKKKNNESASKYISMLNILLTNKDVGNFIDMTTKMNQMSLEWWNFQQRLGQIIYIYKIYTKLSLFVI